VEGRTPGDVPVLAKDHVGRAGKAAANHVETRQWGQKMVLVEGRGRVQRQVRIVGDQGPSGLGVGPADCPLVAAARIGGDAQGITDVAKLAHASQVAAGHLDRLRPQEARVRFRGGRNCLCSCHGGQGLGRVGNGGGRIEGRAAEDVLEK
jgi:hypothetical protein